MSSLPNNFNPSDYEFLIKSLTQGNYVTKAESLKRFNTLVTTDKKQFAIYAKRIVLAIQDLMFQPKEDINLLSSTLALQIVNLNPREIEYYIRSKLLKSIVKNLGDQKPPIRKTSHYCLLAYVKTYKSFDQLIQVYLTVGILSDQWQLRQKSINSLQSILIMEMKYLNWGSNQFKKMFETLLSKLKDQNAYVQKASEQCLLSLCKMEDLRSFSKKLIPQHFQILKFFCQQQLQNGNLQQIKLDIEQKKLILPPRLMHESRHESTRQLPNGGSLMNLQKIKMAQQSSQKRAIINRIEEIRRNNSNHQTPKIDREELQSFRKAESMIMVNNLKQHKKKVLERQKTSDLKLQPIKRQPLVQKQKEIASLPKVQNIVSKKLIDDLKNDTDWKVRLEAIEELHSKYENNKETFDLQSLTKVYIPILVKLLGDSNFKVALISLKIIEDVLLTPNVSLQLIVPHLVERLSDNKIALRQNISKIIRSEYLRTKQNIWIQGLLTQLKKASNSNTKEQILSILGKFYEQKHNITYSTHKIVESVCPLMEDLKTKIKIKTLDLLVLITLRDHNRQGVKSLLMGKLNQVYYEMYSEKLTKELRNKQKQTTGNISTDESIPATSIRSNRATTLISKRYSKNVGNTTSTSLQRDKVSKLDPNDTVRTSSFLQKNSKRDPQNRHSEDLQNTNSKISLHDPGLQSPSKGNQKKKSFLKSFKKKGLRPSDYKSTNYSTGQEYEPFNDPQKQLRSVLTEIKSEDWEICFETLNKIKRINAHHKDLLNPAVLKVIVPQIMRLVENLRSSLSKNAIVTLNELAIKVKRGLDSQLDLIFGKLIKKSLDANSFISDEVKKVLVNVCSNCNQSKVVTLLTNSHTARAIPIKQVIAHILENITFLPKMFQKELERIVVILNDFMSQGSLQIREKAKNILTQILATEKSKQVIRLISAEYLNKLKKSMNEERVPELKVVQKQASVIEQKKQEEEVNENHRQSIKKKKQKINVFPEQFNGIEGLLQKCQSSDWKVRLQSMSEIGEIYLAYPEQACQHRLNSKFIDVLSKQIGDPNVKVATNALRLFKRLIKAIPTLIQNNLSVVSNQIFNCFASQKVQVKTLSEELFDDICVGIQSWMLLQHMCNGILYGVQKSKVTIIQKLCNIVESSIKAKPNIFQKNVYSMINKVAEEGKPQLLSYLKKLILMIQDQVGESCMDYLKPKAKQLLRQ